MGLLQIPGFLLTLAMGLILMTDTIELLEIFIGPLAYVIWIFVVPIFAPAGLFLPWFDAWVFGKDVNPIVLWLWVAWLVHLAILGIMVALPELFRRFKS
jgi:hypothetical protein